MPKISHIHTPAEKRRMRIRSKMFGTAERPRISIFRTNQHTYLQAFDDAAQKTIAAASDLQAKATAKTKKVAGTKSERATKLAEQIAAALAKQGITKAIFDRGSFRYHGRVKTVAEALRAAGVEV